jgi:quinoprotein glucose dehydrogenase
MYRPDLSSALRKGLFCCLALTGCASAFSGELASPAKANQPKVSAASSEGADAIRSLRLPPGFKAELIAAEPHLANPVAFHIDETGKIYVCETFRLHAGVTDIRGHMDWLDEDMAARTVDDRYAYMQRHMGKNFATLSENSERVRLLLDTNGDGKIDDAKVFAESFNHPMDGIAAGVLARKGSVYYANLPNLWLLKDTNNDGAADFRKSLSYGYGVRVGFLGHDLHGLTFGPDGRLYFSIGDRGTAVKIGGKTIGDPDAGNVFRCNADGSDLEVFAFGLRNPQELAFDEHGNLFTGDNNSDGGDKARWVYVVEGGDSGWRAGYQHINEPNSRGAWNSEKLWYPEWSGQAAYIVPPITNISSGPSGLAYYPGTGLPDKYNGSFFLCDFRGARGSGIHTFKNKQRGAGFELVQHEEFVWDGLPTDVDFGVDGGVYFSDWVNGWGMNGKGRIYRVFEPESAKKAIVAETKKLRAEGFEKRGEKELAKLLGHADQRVRQEAQFELAARGAKSLKTLNELARKNDNELARLHAIWGLWQLGLAHVPGAADGLLPLLKDAGAEVRAQAAKVLGDLRRPEAFAGLAAMLTDSEPRPRFFAATALGRLGRQDAQPALLALARANGTNDVYIRHAVVMGLSGIADQEALLAAANDSSPAARMAVLLALRRLERPEVGHFLADADPLLAVEAARAINDVPINGGVDALANLKLSQGAPVELSRRVANANLRYGTKESAQRLVAMAQDDSLPNRIRMDALENLADWEHPAGRDRITGLWRPTPGPRDVKHAREALQPQIVKLLAGGPDQVRLAAARAASALNLSGAVDELARWIRESAGTARMRIEALNALNRLDPVRLGEVIGSARADNMEEVRKEAIRIGAQLKTVNPAEQLAAVLESGSTGEKQSALAALGGLDAGDKILDAWLDKLSKGEVAKELQLDVVDAAAKRPALKDKLAKTMASIGADDPAKELNLALHGGNATAGRTLFLERADLACLRCHKVGGEGGDVGPDLTGFASRQTREYILEAIAYPNKHIAQGYNSVTLKLKNGSTVAGVLKSETAEQLVINSPEDGVMTIKASDITAKAPGLSAMPEGLTALMSRQDLRNLIEFLAAQK